MNGRLLGPGAVLTVLTVLAGLLAMTPVRADEQLPARSINAEPGQITYFAPVSTTVTNWTIEGEIPEWLGGVGTGEWDERGYATRFAVLVQPWAPYGETVKLPLVEYSAEREPIRYDLLLTVGQGVTLAPAIDVVGVAGATTRVDVAGQETGSWELTAAPSWITSGGSAIADGRVQLLYLDLGPDAPVDARVSFTVTEQQRDANGRDLGQVQREVTLTVMPPLERSWPTIEASTLVTQPLTLDGRRTDVPVAAQLEVRGTEPQAARALSSDAVDVSYEANGSVRFTPGMAQGGKQVDLTWQLGYSGVVGADVRRSARVNVEWVPGARPKVRSSADPAYVQAGRSYRGQIALAADGAGEQRLWSVGLRGMRGTRDPESGKKPSVNVADGSLASVVVPADAVPGSYRVMARVTDEHGPSGSTRVGVLHVVKQLRPVARLDRVRVRDGKWTTVDPLRNDMAGATPKGASSRNVSGVQLRVTGVAGVGAAKVVKVRDGKRVVPRVRILSHRPGTTLRVRYEVTNAAGVTDQSVIRVRVTR